MCVSVKVSNVGEKSWYYGQKKKFRNTGQEQEPKCIKKSMKSQLLSNPFWDDVWADVSVEASSRRSPTNHSTKQHFSPSNQSLIKFSKCLILLTLGDPAKLYTEFMCSFLILQTSNISSPCLTLPRVRSLSSPSLIKQLQDPLDLSTIQVLVKALNLWEVL